MSVDSSIPTLRISSRFASSSPAAAATNRSSNRAGNFAPDSCNWRRTDFSEVIGIMPGMIGRDPNSGSAATSRSRSRR